MKIENIPSEWIKLVEVSICEFSKNSRYIYSIPGRQDTSFAISCFDVMYNRYVTLLPDESVTNLLTESDGFVRGSGTPNICLIDEHIMIILFDDNCFEYSDDGNTLLLLIELDFEKRTYHLIDNLAYSGCFHSMIVKEEDTLALVHSFVVDKEEFDRDQYLGCYILQLEEGNRKMQQRNERIVFDYDFQNRNITPNNFWLYSNKLWLFRHDVASNYGPYVNFSTPQGRSDSPDVYVEYDQLSFFDLNESKPKEITFELIPQIDSYSQWIHNYLIRFQKDSKIESFNLDTKIWGELQNSLQLQQYDMFDEKLIRFQMSRCFATPIFYFYCNNQFNVTAVDKSTRTLIQVSFKNPQKLYNLAWVVLLNSGLLDQQQFVQKLPKNLLLPQFV